MQPGAAAGEPERTFIETARRAQIVAAAIDTIAEAGYAGASFARIAEKLGISRGLISYHFAGKDDLMRQVVHDAAEEAKAYMHPRILAESPGPGMLRAYIESNLAFMRDHRNNVIAMVEIARSAEGRRVFYRDTDVVDAVRALEHLLSGPQAAGQIVPAGPGPGVRHRQLRQRDRLPLRPGNPHRGQAVTAGRRLQRRSCPMRAQTGDYHNA
jgi:AcrR family transcriptional regulator